MGTIRATCGHVLSESEGMGFQALTATYSRDGSRAYDSQTLCRKCFNAYRRKKLLLTQTQAEEWLAGDPNDT